MTRHKLGIISVVLLIACAVLWFMKYESSIYGAFFRIGLIMGVIWLAFPQVNKFENWKMFIIILLVVMMIFRLSPLMKVGLLISSPFLYFILRPKKPKPGHTTITQKKTIKKKAKPD